MKDALLGADGAIALGDIGGIRIDFESNLSTMATSPQGWHIRSVISVNRASPSQCAVRFPGLQETVVFNGLMSSRT
jgi:hypothetical protein